MSSVSMSQATADALSEIGLGDFGKVETPERMAWVLLVLQRIEDTPKRFPHGKWATIQNIERQVLDYVCVRANELDGKESR